jgi:hypothetical protein
MLAISAVTFNRFRGHDGGGDHAGDERSAGTDLWCEYAACDRADGSGDQDRCPRRGSPQIRLRDQRAIPTYDPASPEHRRLAGSAHTRRRVRTALDDADITTRIDAAVNRILSADGRDLASRSTHWSVRGARRSSALPAHKVVVYTGRNRHASARSPVVVARRNRPRCVRRRNSGWGLATSTEACPHRRSGVQLRIKAVAGGVSAAHYPCAGASGTRRALSSCCAAVVMAEPGVFDPYHTITKRYCDFTWA